MLFQFESKLVIPTATQSMPIKVQVGTDTGLNLNCVGAFYDNNAFME